MKVPCYNCNKRHLGCHGECKDYQDYKKWKNEYNEKVRNDKKINSMILEIRDNKFTKRR